MAEADARCSRVPVVLRTFNRLPEGGLAPGNDALNHVRRSPEGGRAFARVEDAQTPARACAHVKDTTSGCEGFSGKAHRPVNFSMVFSKRWQHLTLVFQH